MAFINLYEAYAAVYNEDLREDLMIVDEDLSFVDDLSDTELTRIMEEIFYEGEFELNECVELLDFQILSEETEMERMNRLQNKATRERKSAAATAKREKSAERERVGRKHAVKRLQVAATRAGRNLADRAKTLGAGAASAAMGGAAEARRKLSSAKEKVKGFLGKVKKAAGAGYQAAKKEFSGQASKEAKARETGRQMRRAARKNVTRDTSEFKRGPVGTSSNPRIGQPGEERKALPPGRSASSSASRRSSAAKKLRDAAAGEGPTETQQGQPAGTFKNKKTREQARKREERLTAAESLELLDLLVSDMISEGYAIDIYEAYEIIENLDNQETFSLIESYIEQEETFDVYDVVLEHLVAEGYADTNENALVIMANMSEEWKEEILNDLDEAQKPLPTQKMKNRRYYVNMKTGEAAGSSRNQRIDSVLQAYQKDPEGEAAKARAKSKYRG